MFIGYIYATYKQEPHKKIFALGRISLEVVLSIAVKERDKDWAQGKTDKASANPAGLCPSLD